MNDLGFDGLGIGKACGCMKYTLKRLELVPT